MLLLVSDLLAVEVLSDRQPAQGVAGVVVVATLARFVNLKEIKNERKTLIDIPLSDSLSGQTRYLYNGQKGPITNLC